MALRQLLLAKQREDLTTKLGELNAQDFTARRAVLDSRKADLEMRINALNADDEETRKNIEGDVAQLETDYAALAAEEAAHDRILKLLYCSFFRKVNVSNPLSCAHLRPLSSEPKD